MSTYEPLEFETHLDRTAKALERIALTLDLKMAPTSQLVNLLFDGTAKTYMKVMQMFYGAYGINDNSTPEQITAATDAWYAITRQPWDGGMEFAQPDVTAVSTGTKYGDNANMVCSPSTDTVANRDDYAGHPFFACVDCNWTIDASTLKPLITAIKGITSNFERSNPKKYVGVLQQNGYTYRVEGGSSYREGWSTEPKPLQNCDHPFGKNPDGTFRQWMLHGKYPTHVNSDNTMTCCAEVPPTGFLSHNTLHDKSKATGTGYSGGTAADWSFLKYMAKIKYGLTLDGIIQGCCNHSAQHAALVSETGVNRILITNGQTGMYVIGSRILIGARSSSGIDRYYNYNISGADGRKITDCKAETVNGTTYTAIYVDGDSFDTVAGDTNTVGATVVSTWHWDTGTTDAVLGNDGSIVSNTSGKYPGKIQGIEFMTGGYEVIADTILKLTQDASDTSIYYYEPYLVKRTAAQSAGVTSNYIPAGHKLKQPSAEGWQYQRKEDLKNGLLYPCDISGGSSSTYHRDATYLLAKTTGERELLVFGVLDGGAALAGVSCSGGNLPLGGAWWNFCARLSPNGNWGELPAA